MVRHIVLFRIGATAAEQRRADLAEMTKRLESLHGVVPDILSLGVHGDLGTVEGHWDVALVSEHTDAEALATYQGHPAHREVVRWLNTVVTDRAVVDHELP